MNKNNSDWKTALVDAIDQIPKKNVTELMEQLTKIKSTIYPVATSYFQFQTSKYFLDAFNENIKIAKTLLYRIKEMSKLIKTLQQRNNNIFCSLVDFDTSVSILEKRIYKNSKISFADSASRKYDPKWYFDQLQMDIQTLGTLLNTLNIDFNIFNNKEFLTTQNVLNPCTHTPNIQTDSSYTDDISNTYKYCKDGVCSALSSYMHPKSTRKLKRGKKLSRKTRKHREQRKQRQYRNTHSKK